MKTNNYTKKENIKKDSNIELTKKIESKKAFLAKNKDNCPVNPAEGINYLPPKDENTL